MRVVAYDRYGGPERLGLATRPVPEPARGQVRVRLHAVGLNLSDWEFLTGSPAYARLMGLRRPRKSVLGSDVAGVVEALGEGVTSLALGDRVFGDAMNFWGGFAEAMVLPAERLLPLPRGVDMAQAAALPQSGAIAWHGIVRLGGLGAGSAVLINGAGGGSGVLAIQMAQAAGARVVAVDAAEKLNGLRDLGVERALDYRKVDFCTLNDRFDLILDLFATRPARRVAGMLADGGRYLAVGGHMGAVLSTGLWGPVRGIFRSGRVGVLAVEQDPATLAKVSDLAASGAIRPAVTHYDGLDSIPEAMAALGAGRTFGKIVVRLP